MTRHKVFLLLFTFVRMQYSFTQTTSIDQLPVNIIPAANDTTRPMIVYVTGDGGWNKFSKNLSQALATKGYPVIALNARDYFWKKKTAEKTALDIGLLIRNYTKLWNRKKIILIGYSFGADVMPFIFNRLPTDLSTAAINISLLSPSPFTDFEIHLAVMLGAGFSGGESVVAALNKITLKPLTIIFGKGENYFPLNQLTIKNYTKVILDGGHHYDGDADKVCDTILSHLPRGN